MSNKGKTKAGWLLLSILYADKGNGATLGTILINGDWINHAIFSEDELVNGLTRLQQAQLIRKRENLIYKEEKARKILKEESKAFDLYNQWDTLDDYLIENNIEKSAIQKDESADIESFVRKNFRSAYENYLNKVSSRVKRSILKNE